MKNVEELQVLKKNEKMLDRTSIDRFTLFQIEGWFTVVKAYYKSVA